MEEPGPGRRQASRLRRGARGSIAVVGLHTQHGSRASGVARRRVRAWQSALSPSNRAHRCARFVLVRCYAPPRPRVSKNHLFTQSNPQVGTGLGVSEPSLKSQQTLGFALVSRRHTATNYPWPVNCGAFWSFFFPVGRPTMGGAQPRPSLGLPGVYSRAYPHSCEASVLPRLRGNAGRAAEWQAHAS
jgi:hypothetical protein